MDYSALPPEELFLACLRAGDERAWAEFLRRFQPLIIRVIIKIASHWGDNSPQTVEELVQETYLKLCDDRATILRSFHSVHADSVFGYLKVFAANLAQDHFKAAHARKRGGTLKIESSESVFATDRCLDVRTDRQQVEHGILVREIETILGELIVGPNAERDKLIFWLYYRSGLTASAIASIVSVGLTTKGVESTLQRLTSLLRDHVCRSQALRLNPELSGKGTPLEDSL